MRWKELIIAIVICQLAGIIGSFFTLQSIPTWYTSLAKPSFTPPNWVFGPVWITLYTLMGVSAFWIFSSKNKKQKMALYIFACQLILNTLWSVVFFGLQSSLYGLIIIILLWLSIIATIVKFHEIDKRAGLILIPYLLWVSFASILNFWIYILN
ncbi:tryptophan-rich sensory protein [Candidatus Micrarchaeota archaeon]|nr:tryptophan-rich sensory protein [Candidatus Micrarchaeota archaeon]